jgi:hypothetical protein
MARTDPQVNVRMPLDLKQWLVTQAAKSGRSFTTEVITALEAHRACNTAKWPIQPRAGKDEAPTG